MDSFKIFTSYFKRQYKYFCFVALHLYRSFMVWLHSIIVEPLESIVEKYLKNEPTETNWVQFYSLTTCAYIADFGIERFAFDSMESYLCPVTNYFDLFVKNEYDLFLNHSVKKPKYDHEFDQTPEIIETLFVARKEDRYIFRTFPVFRALTNYKEFGVMPEKSDIQFVIIEYKHPKMLDKIELKIPDSFYLVNNELLSPAFIQRLLELQRSYYVFDFDYEVMFIDDDLESRKLHFNNYVKLEKTSYKICSTYSENNICENIVEEALPEKEEALPEKEEALPEKEEALPEKEEALPVIEETLPEKEAALPVIEETNEWEHITEIEKVVTPLSNTFVVACCLLMGGGLPLAQIMNLPCRFTG